LNKLELVEDQSAVIDMIAAWSKEDKYITMLPDNYTEELSSSLMYLVKDEGETVGCASLEIIDSNAHCAVYTLEQHRKKGYGTEMIKEIHAEARRQGAKKAYGVIKRDNHKCLSISDNLDKLGELGQFIMRGEDL